MIQQCQVGCLWAVSGMLDTGVPVKEEVQISSAIKNPLLQEDVRDVKVARARAPIRRGQEIKSPWPATTHSFHLSLFCL